ncbi:MAG: hypothetical protein ACRDGD_08420 [Candidatus Limnocylindria bacterium]
MISVAVRGYGLVIWDEPGAWRVFSISTRAGTSLAARVDDALRAADLDGSEAVRRALLSITGSLLLVDSAFPECDGDCDCDDDALRN